MEGDRLGASVSHKLRRFFVARLVHIRKQDVSAGLRKGNRSRSPYARPGPCDQYALTLKIITHIDFLCLVRLEHDAPDGFPLR